MPVLANQEPNFKFTCKNGNHFFTVMKSTTYCIITTLSLTALLLTIPTTVCYKQNLK